MISPLASMLLLASCDFNKSTHNVLPQKPGTIINSGADLDPPPSPPPYVFVPQHIAAKVAEQLKLGESGEFTGDEWFFLLLIYNCGLRIVEKEWNEAKKNNLLNRESLKTTPFALDDENINEYEKCVIYTISNSRDTLIQEKKSYFLSRLKKVKEEIKKLELYWEMGPTEDKRFHFLRIYYA